MGVFVNQHVLITGASSGIGYALAHEFAQRGANLSLMARRKIKLDELAEKLRKNHPEQKFWVFESDITSDTSVQKAILSAMEHLGPLDVVVANAGFGVAGEITALSLDDYRRQFETNVFGVLRTIKETLSSLKQTQGRLAIIGSVNGYVSLPGISPYAMSKFSIRALCDALYHELLPMRVSVTHIAPGFVSSEIRQVNNRGEFKEKAKDPIPLWLQMSAPTAAKKIADAIYRRKRERIVTGHGWWIVRFQRFFPGAVCFLIKVFKIKARSEPSP